MFWKADIGLKVLLDGVDYGVWNKQGKRVLKPQVGPPYIVLGRLNTNDRETWISPADADLQVDEDFHWEMANFVLGEVAYFDSLISENEYRDHLGLSGISSMRNYRGYFWHGKGLVDASVLQLMTASSNYYSKPGPILGKNRFATIKYLPEVSAVELRNGSSLRLGVFPVSSCPVKLTDCTEVGFSYGTEDFVDNIHRMTLYWY